jgi:hypothetical protein
VSQSLPSASRRSTSSSSARASSGSSSRSPKLINAKSKDRKGVEGIGGRYAVYDVEYDAPGGEGKRSKITFISWVPDDATQYVSIDSGNQRNVCLAEYTAY